jgi:hypothetical protein
MYAANGWVIYHYYARLYYPDGSISNWQEGETGGWWVTKAGTYQIEGKAYGASIFNPGYVQELHRYPFSFYVVDNYAPTTPQNFQVSSPLNQNPVLTWNANSEADLSGYRVYKKYTISSGGTMTTSIFTINTNYTDGDFTANYKTGEDVAEYWVTAEDINNNVSNETTHQTVDVTSHIQWKIAANIAETPVTFNLSQNYPNPFNPVTKISYSIKEKGLVVLKVYDVLGNEVATLVNEEKEAGVHSIVFDSGKLASGTYIYTIRFKNKVESKRMILMK